MMMRRERKFWLGRRGSTAPGPGVGVLLKKLRSRWTVSEPRYWRVRAVPLQSSRSTSKLHCVLRALGSSRVGEIMSGRGTAASWPVGFANESVGFAGSEVYVVTGASGGLLVRNVTEFIWLGV